LVIALFLVNVKDTLSEFWIAKSAGRDGLSDIRYESETRRDGSCVCFVTLPGGSCFGSFEECRTTSEAQKNAAKIALVHSVFNDHVSRVITEKFIEEAVTEARKSSGEGDPGIEAFRFMLSENLGKTMLEFQEIMAVFSLLQWNGDLKEMADNKMSQKDVISQFSHKKIDKNMREDMASNWFKKEKSKPGTIAKELADIEIQLQTFRHAGQELRFCKEKRDIMMYAINCMLHG